MKIRLKFKTPDVLFNSLQDLGLNEDEKEEVTQIAQKFIEYDEYVTIIIDTETAIATVEEV